jgi:rhamnosyltransferase subunit B
MRDGAGVGFLRRAVLTQYSAALASKRVLLATFGSLGDLHPYLAVALELKRRGHRPVIATLDRYRAALEGNGIEFALMRPSEAQLGDPVDLVRRLMDPRRGPEYLIRQLVMPHVRESYADLDRAAANADLVVSHPLSLTLPLVAEKRGLPWVSTVLSPMSFFSAHDPSVIAAAPWLHQVRRLGVAPYRWVLSIAKLMGAAWERPLHDLRKEIGLPSTRNLAMFEGQFSPRLNLALFSGLLAAPQPDWPAGTEVCGFARYDGTAPDPSVRAELEDFLGAGEPPIVFTLGSSVALDPGDFFRKAIGAAKRLRRRALLVTASAPEVHADASAAVKVFGYLPYTDVFPHAALNVHPGGIGTLAQALAAGKPMLVTPVAFDQVDNARRAEMLGVAGVIPFAKLTSENLAQAIGDLLARPECAQRAGAIGARVRGENGAARACELLC